MTEDLTPTAATPRYVGRFAPSPTGPLHFGSLVAALASYLDAKANHGGWLVRIEDIDPPREIAGATAKILTSLEAHGLLWDGGLLYQSDRLPAYLEAFSALRDKQLLYPCRCTRKEIAEAGGIYAGTCRHPEPPMRTTESVAWRVRTSEFPEAFAATKTSITFDDLFLGPTSQNIPRDFGDFIVKRKDGLFAYQLAVVVDDIHQNITHVVRGSDLLDSTASQILLTSLLGAELPRHGHCPIVVNELGQKMSKQNRAAPLNNKRASQNLWDALHFLQQNPPKSLALETPATILLWGISHWTLCARKVHH